MAIKGIRESKSTKKPTASRAIDRRAVQETNEATAASEKSNTPRLFPITPEMGANIASHFDGAFRHLAVFMFSALSTLEQTGVREEEIYAIEPKLLGVVEHLAANYTSEDVYTNGLAIAFEAVRLVYVEHRKNDGRLHGFQILAVAVLAYGNHSGRLRKERPNEIHLRADVALQMAVLSAHLIQVTSALSTAIGADRFYAQKRTERGLVGGDTVKQRAATWQEDANREATNICSLYAARLKAADVAQTIYDDWQNAKRHLLQRQNKRTGAITILPPKAATIAKAISFVVESSQTLKPLRDMPKPTSPILTGLHVG